MAEWSRIVNTTIKNYLKGFEDETLRNRKLLAMLRRGGRILYNQGGDGFDWKVKWRRAEMTINNGEQSITFDRSDNYKSANLTYEGYVIKDAITKRERLMNRGPQAIVKIWDTIISQLMEDIEDQFGEEIYVDSSASGNTGRMSGIETFCAATQTLDLSITGHAGRTANSVDVVAYPNDTYAGLLTNLGNYDGTWNTAVASGTSVPAAVSTHWPGGKGDAPFGFYTPILVNYTSSSFNGSSDTWAQQGPEALRFALTHTRCNKSKRGMVDMVLMDRDLYRLFLEKYEASQRLPLSQGGGMGGLWDLGFKDVQNFDGCEVTSEYGITSEVGYGFNLDQMDLRSMQDTIFASEGPDYDMSTRAWRVAVDVLGQFRFQSPRNFFKLNRYA